MVREFYSNLSRVCFPDPIVRIWGKEVYFVAEQINDIYGLSDADMILVEVKSSELGSLLVEKLFLGREVS